jgi:hypothetical protein
MKIQTVASPLLLMALAGPMACKATPPAGIAPAGANAGVQLWPGITEETTPTDLSTAWTASWLNGDFSLKEGRLPGHKARQVANCADLAGVGESDVLLGPAWEHYNFREKSVRCRVVSKLRAARPARIGYARDLVESSDPGDVLPAEVAPVTSATAAAGQAAAGRSWRAVEPTVRFDREGARSGYHELIVRGAYRGRLTWWAAADVDGDGIEDVVMFSNLTPAVDGSAGAAPNVMRAFFLTRKAPAGPVTIVDRVE